MGRAGIRIHQSIALILISTTLCSAEATVPVGAAPAVDTTADDGALLPGLFQEKISAAIDAREWPAALDMIDRYMTVVHRTAPVTTDDGSSYRDERTLSGFDGLLCHAVSAYGKERNSASFRQAELDHLQKYCQEVGELVIAAELSIPLSAKEIESIKDLLNDPQAVMVDPVELHIPQYKKMEPIPVTGPDYRNAIALARFVDIKLWARYGAQFSMDYIVPLPKDNPTPFSAIHLTAGTTTPYFIEFVAKAPTTSATSAVTTKASTP